MRPLILFALLFFFVPAALAGEWGRYENARFGYAVAVPPGFAGAGESDNADGQVFRSADGTQNLRAWGGNVLEESFEAEAAASMGYSRDDGWTLSYERSTPGWASWSGRRNGIVLYARMISLCGGTQYAAFQLEYPQRDLDAMNPVVEKLVGSLRATGDGAGC